MKILLVYPPCLEERVHIEDAEAVPIGLFYIGALLREKGYAVEVINGQALRDRPEPFRDIVETFHPDVVGFSILQANRWAGIEQARLVKAVNPGVVTVFGGISGSLLWRHFLTHFEAVDFVIIGEGEIPFLNLVRWVENGGGDEALKSINGLAFRENGRPLRTDCPEPITDLDALPNPAGHFVYPHVALTRGCPSNCRFCGSPDFWGRRVRFHSAAYFVDQLEILSQGGVSFFYVSDDTFTSSKQRTIDVCKTIISRKLEISWAAISRVDAVEPEILGWMRRAGCVQISYGVESGSKEIRAYLGKRFSDKTIEGAFGETLRHGILPRAYFIYGCPGESPETIQQTLGLIRRIRPLGAVFYILDIFPGTELYREFCEKTGVDDDVWLQRIEDIPYFETDPALSRDIVLEYGRTLRNGFHRMLPEIVESICLTEDPDFAPLHADFLSRLGMTFHRGAYSGLKEIPDSAAIAERLYGRSLDYQSNPRAYLGLGMLHQERRQFDTAADILDRGLSRFPDDRELSICLALCHMNTGRFKTALDILKPFTGSEQAALLVTECLNRLKSKA